MTGKVGDPDLEGITPRAIEEMFQIIERDESKFTFKVTITITITIM